MTIFVLFLLLLIALAIIATTHGADSRKHDRPNWW